MKATVMTLKTINRIMSEGLSKKQAKANLQFLKDTHSSLKDGGTWVYPDAGCIFIKEDHGFYLGNLDGPVEVA